MSDDRSRECVLKILNKHSTEISTGEILEETKLYPSICKGCRSGSNIMRIAIKLLNEGIIDRSITKGGFKWKIK